MNDRPKTSWCLIPPQIWEDEGLNLTEKCLVGRVIALQDSKGYCYASNSYLANQLGRSTTTISKNISKLVKKGYLERSILRDTSSEVKERRIWVSSLVMIPLWSKTRGGIVENDHTPMVENDKYRVDIKDKSERVENTQKHPSDIREIANEIISYWNTKYERKFKVPVKDNMAWLPNLGKWLDTYSPSEIKEAIDVAQVKHHFYKDKISPDKLFRSHEDRLGEMLNYKGSTKSTDRNQVPII